MLLPYAAKSSGDSWGREWADLGEKVTLDFIHLCADSLPPYADTRWRQLSEFKIDQDHSEDKLAVCKYFSKNIFNI